MFHFGMLFSHNSLNLIFLHAKDLDRYFPRVCVAIHVTYLFTMLYYTLHYILTKTYLYSCLILYKNQKNQKINKIFTRRRFGKSFFRLWDRYERFYLKKKYEGSLNFEFTAKLTLISIFLHFLNDISSNTQISWQWKHNHWGNDSKKGPGIKKKDFSWKNLTQSFLAKIPN